MCIEKKQKKTPLRETLQKTSGRKVGKFPMLKSAIHRLLKVGVKSPDRKLMKQPDVSCKASSGRAGTPGPTSTVFKSTFSLSTAGCNLPPSHLITSMAYNGFDGTVDYRVNTCKILCPRKSLQGSKESPGR